MAVMVQLKSFKSIEPDSVADRTAPESGPTPASTRPTDEAEANISEPRQHNQTNQVESSMRSTSSASKTSSSSAGSINATISGGNLTNSSSQDRLTQHTSERDTLSSGEEYQVAKHELVEEEGEPYIAKNLPAERRQQVLDGDISPTNDLEQSIPLTDELVDGSRTSLPGAAGDSVPLRLDLDAEDDATTRINIVSSVSVSRNQPETGLISSIQTPKTPRLKLYQPRSLSSSPALGKAACQSPMLRQGAMSPASKRLATIVAMGSNGGDNTSQYSLNQQRNPNNQFEIRWQNLRLNARRTKLPRFIADSSLYKFIYKQEDLQLAQDTCYSPPIQHKIPPTISELAELDSKTLAREATRTPTYETANQESELRCILDNVSGSVFSGQITAILGPSGVGKTTLLNSLTGRNTLDGTGRVSLLGGASKRMSVVTVPQADVLPGRLTTYEDLIFTSRLKNPQSGFDHERNVDKIVKHLHMDKFLHTKINKLSGGEARRLSIGRELLNSPDIMILDEPTSGLDANTCKKIIIALRDIVEHSDYILDRPMSIIVTIHQPQQEVYNLFHRVYVMAIGGHAIYGGPPNLLLPTLMSQSSLNQAVRVDQLNENPAIVAIEVASGEYGQEIIEELAFHHENRMYEEFLGFGDDITAASPMLTPQAFRNARKNPLNASPRVDMIHRKRLDSTDSSIGRPTPMTMRRNLSANQLDRLSAVTSVSYASTYDAYLPEQTSRLKVDKRLRRSVVMKGDFISHTRTLMGRCWLLATRDWFLMGIRILGFLLVAAGTVQIFSTTLDPDQHLCPLFQSEVDNIPSFIQVVKGRLTSLESIFTQSNSVHMFFFNFLLCITMVTSAITGLVFPLQMRMFLREYKNGWYSAASFVTSQTLAELPIDMIGPIITIVIAYPLSNQPESPYHWREIGYAIIIILTSIITKSQAQIIGAFLMDSVENSVFMSCVAVTFPALLSGIPLPIREMTAPLRLASYTSFLKYAFESLLSLRYGYGLCPCDPDLIYGYPVEASTSAIPTQLTSLVRGFLALNGINGTDETVTTTGFPNEDLPAPPDAQHNIFLSYIRLVTGASNLFVPDMEQLGDCSTYRSLYLLAMNIPNSIVTRWLVVMVAMFIISRFLIYFVVKIVIKLRK